jgi:hypothetical protein
VFDSPYQLPEDRRRVLFAALIEAEDRGATFQMARTLLAIRFGVSRDQVRCIEREGLDQHWPPLPTAGR